MTAPKVVSPTRPPVLTPTAGRLLLAIITDAAAADHDDRKAAA